MWKAALYRAAALTPRPEPHARAPAPRSSRIRSAAGHPSASRLSAMAAVFRAIVGYCFLDFMMRIAGREGQQRTRRRLRPPVRARDGSAEVTYDRVERHGTPSILTVRFGPAAVQHNKAQLWVSDDLIRDLGNRRVSPQPESSVLERGGILYSFPAGAPPLAAQFSLQPTSVGRASIALQVPGRERLSANIFVMP